MPDLQIVILFVLKSAIMKKIIITCIFLSPVATQAQIVRTDIKEMKDKVDTVSESIDKYMCRSKTGDTAAIDKKSKSEVIITSESYKRYIDKYFTYLSYNRGTLPTGTTATMELADKETQLNLSLSKKMTGKNGRILLATAGMRAKIDDNISEIFSGSKLNTGTSFFANFAFMPKNARGKLKIVTDKYDENGNHTDVLKSINDARKNLRKAYCKRYSAEFLAKYKCLLDRLMELRSKKLTEDCADKLSIINDIEAIEKKLADAGLSSKSAEELTKSVLDAYQDELYEIETENEAWLSMHVFWISGGINYAYDAYTTYDDSKPLSNRFGSQNFESVGLKLTANWFKDKFNAGGAVRSRYFNISYEPKRTNSFESLSSVDVLNLINHGSNADTFVYFMNNKKPKDITGVEYKTSWMHNFSSTYTIMLGEKRNFGFNFNGLVQISPLSAPIYNAHAGLLLSLKNTDYDPTDKDSKAKVNFEIFLRLPDMTDVAKSGNTVWQNRVIGINTSIPFNKIFFK